MKIINVSVPTIDEIKRLPAYQRKNDNSYAINSQSTTLNYNMLAYVDKNGLISTTGKEFSNEDVRLEIDFQIGENENINIGDIIEYNDVLFMVIDNNKAVSLENIPVPNIFKAIYTTSDPNKGNDILDKYIINDEVLTEWFESSNKTAQLIDCEKYNTEEHTTVEKKLFSEIIKYDYQNRKENGLNDELTEEKIKEELETPNVFISELISFFIEVTKNNCSLTECAFYLLKRNRKFKFNDEIGNLSSEQKELLTQTAEKIQKIYLLSLKYEELNNNYNDYLKEIVQKKSIQR